MSVVRPVEAAAFAHLERDLRVQRHLLHLLLQLQPEEAATYAPLLADPLPLSASLLRALQRLLFTLADDALIVAFCQQTFTGRIAADVRPVLLDPALTWGRLASSLEARVLRTVVYRYVAQLEGTVLAQWLGYHPAQVRKHLQAAERLVEPAALLRLSEAALWQDDSPWRRALDATEALPVVWFERLRAWSLAAEPDDALPVALPDPELLWRAVVDTGYDAALTVLIGRLGGGWSTAQLMAMLGVAQEGKRYPAAEVLHRRLIRLLRRLGVTYPRRTLDLDRLDRWFPTNERLQKLLAEAARDLTPARLTAFKVAVTDGLTTLPQPDPASDGTLTRAFWYAAALCAPDPALWVLLERELRGTDLRAAAVVRGLARKSLHVRCERARQTVNSVLRLDAAWLGTAHLSEDAADHPLAQLLAAWRGRAEPFADADLALFRQTACAAPAPPGLDWERVAHLHQWVRPRFPDYVIAAAQQAAAKRRGDES